MEGVSEKPGEIGERSLCGGLVDASRSASGHLLLPHPWNISQPLNIPYIDNP
jgi:hypothetical protein